MSPANLTVALNVPLLVNLVILKVALPFELVVALYVLPLTVIVTLAFAIAFPDFDFKAIMYFLGLVFTLNVLAAVIFDAYLTNLMVADFVVALYSSSPANVTFAILDPVAVALSVTVAMPFKFVVAL